MDDACRTPPAALAELVATLVAALGRQLGADGVLFDPVDAAPTPSDHYGQLAAALAFACHPAGSAHQAREALRTWLAIDERAIGHLPFNRLLLLLLRTVVHDRGLFDERDRALIESGLRRCVLRRRYPSNNWTLLAQACRLLESEGAARVAARRRFCRLIARWTTTKGGFIDFPAQPAARASTPLAYHHKALFLAVLATWFDDSPEIAHHAARLLDWLVHCWTPAGYAGGLGRSTHALFGDACLIAALVLSGGAGRGCDAPLATLAGRLRAQTRADGLLWLNPAGACSGAASWDGYMHLSVYNAWAAAIIGVALHFAAHRARPVAYTAHWEGARAGVFHDEEAGLLCMRAPPGTVLLATRGQPAQSFSRTEADFRYAGGVVLHLETADGAARVPPPLRVRRAALERAPVLAGWTPLLRASGEYYAVDQFDAVTVGEDAEGLRVVLEGVPRRVFRAAPSGFWQRLVATVDWRVLGGRLGRRQALRRAPLHGLNVRLAITIASDAVLPAAVLTLECSTPAAVEYLNPQGLLLVLPRRTADHEGGAVAAPGADGWVVSSAPSALPGAFARCRAATVLPQGTSTWRLAVSGADWGAGEGRGSEDQEGALQ